MRFIGTIGAVGGAVTGFVCFDAVVGRAAEERTLCCFANFIAFVIARWTILIAIALSILIDTIYSIFAIKPAFFCTLYIENLIY